MLIEELSGLPYADYLNREIFQPLGMTSTGYDSAVRILPERASGYTRQRGGEVVDGKYIHMSVPFSAGGLYSTPAQKESRFPALVLSEVEINF